MRIVRLLATRRSNCMSMAVATSLVAVETRCSGVEGQELSHGSSSTFQSMTTLVQQSKSAMLNLVGWTGATTNASTTPPRHPEPGDRRSCQLPPRDEHRLSTQSAMSLTSSRPAPPSPAMSRRASGLSRSSSAQSRPLSGTSGPVSRPSSGVLGTGSLAPAGTPLSRTLSLRRSRDILGMPAVAESKEGVEPSANVLIKIRDYAYAVSDPRFLGDGPHAPRPNRPKVLARKLRQRTDSSTASSTTTSSEDDDQDGWEDEPNRWSAFQWGFGRGWDLPSKTTGNGLPSQSELDRNFTEEPEAFGEEEEEEGQSEYVDAEEDFSERDDDGEVNDLFPGIYRALYPFEPEGMAEMKLDEEQLVRVIGRGGGIGWAVVVKEGLRDNGIHALVPESYLEPVRLDGEEEEGA